MRAALLALATVALCAEASPAAAGVPPDDQLILEGLWVTPDGRPQTVTQAGSTFTITGPPPPGACPRPGGVFGTVAPTGDPSVYAGETFRYDTDDCSVVGTAPLQINVAQDPNVPEVQSFAGTSEGQTVGTAKRPETNATVDVDRDGIPDWTETNGINVLGTDAGGAPVDVLLNFPAMGADPAVRDVFVEVDSMPGRQFENLALQIVQDAFLLGGGINLHVDNGPGSVMDPRTEATWQQRSEGTATVPFKSKLGANAGGSYDLAEFYALKEQFFRTDVRGTYFRYAIAANKIPGSNDAGDQASGIAAGVGKPDFIVTIPICGKKGEAAYLACSLTTFHQAAVFMHELGHTLGLDHGGNDGFNFKPNYFSVMNYAIAFVGLGAAKDLKTPAGPRRLDYSRFGPGTVSGVDENALVETAGVQVPNPSEFSLVRYCAKPSRKSPGKLFQAGGPVDWSCNGSINPAPVPFDVNFDGQRSALESFDDWGNLNLTRPARARTRRGGGVLVPYQETRSVSALLRQAAATLGDTKAPRVRLKQRGRKVVVIAKDRKRVDRLVVSVGREVRSSRPGKTGRTLRVKVRLKRGKNRLAARAMDWAGNQTRPFSRKLRVR
ncbi:MAG: hypothetical protein ACRDLO_14190 [Solirubrobacterales bacterium]